MWLKWFKKYCCRIKNVAYREINELSFSDLVTPTPDCGYCSARLNNSRPHATRKVSTPIPTSCGWATGRLTHIPLDKKAPFHRHFQIHFREISPLNFIRTPLKFVLKDRAHLSTFKFVIFEKFSCFIVLVVFLVVVQSSELISVWFCEKMTFKKKNY